MTLLSGLIKTSENQPMFWVAVIIDPNTENQLITLTDSRGQFAFQTQPGPHRIAVRTFGYQPWTQDMTITRGGEHKEIVLLPTLRKLNRV